MNVSRRIHCLRAHRPKPPAYPEKNWHNSFNCKHWCENEQITVRMLYILIVMVILIAVWGVWTRKDN